MRKTLGLTMVVLLCAVLASVPAVAQTPFVTHNSWSSGAAMPVALKWPMTGVINGQIYVAGGVTDTAIVADNQIYNPVANTWSTGAAMPVATFDGAGAAVNNILYVFGGSQDGKTCTNAVWAYDPTTNTWSGKAAMPTARCGIGAAVNNSIIFVIGGTDLQGNRLNTVEGYKPAANTWTEEVPLPVGKSEPSVGIVEVVVKNLFVAKFIVAADGYTTSGDTGDSEGYLVRAKQWWSLPSDPKPRNSACTGGAGGPKLYVAGGGDNGSPLVMTKLLLASWLGGGNINWKWTLEAPLPHAVISPGSAFYKGLLYCIGGGNKDQLFQGSVFNYVQIYQP